MTADTRFDWGRRERTGVGEAVLAAWKTPEQIAGVLDEARRRDQPLLLTRLTSAQAQALAEAGFDLDYDAPSQTAFAGAFPTPAAKPSVAVVAGGTSDLPVAMEAARSLLAMGLAHDVIADVGVAGLWRLTAATERIERHDLVIAVAGMEGALFSVLAGLVPQPVIAVPTSVGLGVAAGGEAALKSALGGCAPGVVVVNIDNGFGAAAAARKFLRRA